MDRKPVVECEKRIFGPEKGDFEVPFILFIAILGLEVDFSIFFLGLLYVKHGFMTKI